MVFVQSKKLFHGRYERRSVAFAHAHGVKVYVTVNILAHNDDLAGVRRVSKGTERN